MEFFSSFFYQLIDAASQIIARVKKRRKREADCEEGVGGDVGVSGGGKRRVNRNASSTEREGSTRSGGFTALRGYSTPAPVADPLCF